MKTKIEWTEHNWNPLRGCRKHSIGCENCYAEAIARRFPNHWRGFLNDRGEWNGNVKLLEHKMREPLNRANPTIYFVNTMSDTFYRLVSSHYIDRMFEVMRECPQHIFQLLTKRPERADNYYRIAKILKKETWPDNVWMGATVEASAYLHRINDLRRIPAPVRFLSIEPLLESLGPLDLSGIHWVIVGCESGPNARECRLEWVREIRDQCEAQGVAFFLKQLNVDGKLIKTPMLDGIKHTDFPSAFYLWNKERRAA